MDDFNDYYTNNDNYRGYDEYNREIIRNSGASFIVFVMKRSYVAFIIFAILFSAIFSVMIPILIDLAHSGLKRSTDFVVVFMICLLLLVVILFANTAGRRIEINGNSIYIRKWFVFQEETSIINVSHCDVITGLMSVSRYRTTIYNKAVIYYDSGKSISVTDNTYLGWQKLVDYMNYNGKVVNIDGRSKALKWFENFYDNHRNLF